jgi:uncharacterized membrane protein YqjE
MRERPHTDGTEPGLTELLRRLADHASSLVRGEVALAKLEMRESVRALARDSGKLAAALTLAWFGGLALTAALIVGVAHLLDGRFGLAALIVGILFLVIGAILARSGMRALSDGELRPEATIDSIARSRDWAKREIRQLREELAGSHDDAATEAGPTPAVPSARARTLQP